MSYENILNMRSPHFVVTKKCTVHFFLFWQKLSGFHSSGILTVGSGKNAAAFLPSYKNMNALKFERSRIFFIWDHKPQPSVSSSAKLSLVLKKPRNHVP